MTGNLILSNFKDKDYKTCSFTLEFVYLKKLDDKLERF